MAVRIRIHTLADHPELVAQVAAWHFGEWGAHEPGATLALWTEALAEKTLRGAVPTTFVALGDGDSAVGSASLVVNDMATHEELSPWLAGVYVVPELRGRGVGKALVRHTVRAAQSIGVQQLFLFTERAEGLYAALGWQVLMREKYQGRRVTIMVIAPRESG